MRLAGERALVTGSTSGIGRAIAQRFAEEGAVVCVTGRDQVRGDAAVAQITAAGGRAHFVAAELRDEDACTALVATAVERLGGLTVLVNNAAGGEGGDGAVGDITTEAWNAILTVNLTAPMWLTRAAIEHLLTAGHGSIVNISTRQAERASRGFAAYIASKGGLNALTRSIAVDYADRNIRCNTISPGYVLNDRRDADIDDARRARYEGMHLTRLGVADDIAYAAVYFASRESDFVTGLNLQVDGGSSIARGLTLGMTVHPRVCVSAISSFRLDLAGDLELWARHGIDCVGVSVAKLDAFGWEEGTQRISDAGLRVANLIGLGPFLLADPSQWEAQRERLTHALHAGHTLGAECVVFTTGPAGPLPWDEAADALETALAPVLVEARALGIPFAVEHTNSLRVDVGFVHSLRDVVDLARRLGTGVCMEINACWAERALAETIADAVDVIRLVQVSDFKVGTLATPDRMVPGDGDIPLARILAQILAAGYAGVFDLELIGPRIEAEGYESAVPRAVAALGSQLASLGA